MQSSEKNPGWLGYYKTQFYGEKNEPVKGSPLNNQYNRKQYLEPHFQPFLHGCLGISNHLFYVMIWFIIQLKTTIKTWLALEFPHVTCRRWIGDLRVLRCRLEALAGVSGWRKWRKPGIQEGPPPSCKVVITPANLI